MKFSPAGMVELPRISQPVSPHISKLSYRTRLITSRGEFSGIMVIKKMAEEEYRVACFSELGMSYFEAALGPGDHPYHLEFKGLSPFLATEKTAAALYTCLNLLLVPGKVLTRSQPVKDAGGSFWVRSGLENEIHYFGQVDGQGHIVRSYFSMDGKRPGLEMEMVYPPEDPGHPMSVILKDRKGRMVMELTAIERG